MDFMVWMYNMEKRKVCCMEKDRIYAAIDLKSFYASVECVDRGLDPLKTNLVVADASRSSKTICLAVSPSLKACGIGGRPRLFEVIRQMKKINAMRATKNPGCTFRASSVMADELAEDMSLRADYLTAVPRMTRYMEVSGAIYRIYLKYLSPEDIHFYSIDEVFMDVTDYLAAYHMKADELVRTMMLEVLKETGITATAGIGTNLFLAKVAMDIIAKKEPSDENGVRLACLNEGMFKKLLWEHRPLTDFWRIGHGYAAALERNGWQTMGDIARQSLIDETPLYRLFGVNAELLIDHAWGCEPCTMAEIKAYRPKSNSLGAGQVLLRPYRKEEALLVLKEMAVQLALDLADKNLVTDRIDVMIGYEALSEEAYEGETRNDYYGRQVPKPAHGFLKFATPTSSDCELMKAAVQIFQTKVISSLLVRRMNITAQNVICEQAVRKAAAQMDLFADPDAREKNEKKLKEKKQKDKNLQKAVLTIKKRYGKNALIRGMDKQEGATAMERNRQVGGHRA